MNKFEQLILDSIPHWAMIIDCKERTILAANKRAKELGSKINGQCWDDFGHKELLSEEHLELINSNPDRKRDNCIKCTHCKADEAMLENKTYIEETEIDGVIWEVYWVPIDNHIYLHYAIDKTESIEYQNIKIEKHKLETVIKTLGAIAHEFSQPIMVIEGYISMLKYDIENILPDTIKTFDKIQNNTQRLAKLLYQLNNVTSVKMKLYLSNEILDIEASTK